MQIWIRFQPTYRISGSIEGTTLIITKFIATYNHYSCPIIDTGGITLDLYVSDISDDCVDPVKR